MDQNNRRTLGSTLSSVTNGRLETREEMRDFNTYATIFTLSVVNRYTDLERLHEIPVDDITRIAEFSAACVPIFLETWNKVCDERTRRKVA